ncbi:hypothetical protein Golomagni_03961 [Golovinomyces magnicellulatus]|nr:hypothetical protein Golomagni_03961 [Golovinomyces magnicellulatus]
MLLKTTEYLDHFARFKRKENVEAVERLLSAHKELAKFERAQLGIIIFIPSFFYIAYSMKKSDILLFEIYLGFFRTGENRYLRHCSIGSLCCDTAEEAKTLIPSLQDKIGDEELQELLDEITKLMGYIN